MDSPHHKDGINMATNKGVNHVKSSIIFAKDIGAKMAILHPGFINSDKNKNYYLKRSIETISKMRVFAEKNDVELLV